MDEVEALRQQEATVKRQATDALARRKAEIAELKAKMDAELESVVDKLRGGLDEKMLDSLCELVSLCVCSPLTQLAIFAI